MYLSCQETTSKISIFCSCLLCSALIFLCNQFTPRQVDQDISKDLPVNSPALRIFTSSLLSSGPALRESLHVIAPAEPPLFPATLRWSAATPCCTTTPTRLCDHHALLVASGRRSDPPAAQQPTCISAAEDLSLQRTLARKAIPVSNVYPRPPQIVSVDNHSFPLLGFSLRPWLHRLKPCS